MVNGKCRMLCMVLKILAKTRKKQKNLNSFRFLSYPGWDLNPHDLTITRF